jgi:hybrid cluster-associated redox disulfide protein
MPKKNTKENKKITKEMTLAEILNRKGAEKILQKYNFPCLTCPMAKFEIENLKIGQVCEMYGINLEKVLEELNKKD